MTFTSIREIREFPLTEGMKQLLDATEMFVIGDTLYLHSTKTETIECAYIHDDLFTTINGLMDALLETHKFKETSVKEFVRRLAGLWLSEAEKVIV